MRRYVDFLRERKFDFLKSIGILTLFLFSLQLTFDAQTIRLYLLF